MSVPSINSTVLGESLDSAVRGPAYRNVCELAHIARIHAPLYSARTIRLSSAGGSSIARNLLARLYIDQCRNKWHSKCSISTPT